MALLYFRGRGQTKITATYSQKNEINFIKLFGNTVMYVCLWG